MLNLSVITLRFRTIAIFVIVNVYKVVMKIDSELIYCRRTKTQIHTSKERDFVTANSQSGEILEEGVATYLNRIFRCLAGGKGVNPKTLVCLIGF
jgi:hypothetical protein